LITVVFEDHGQDFLEWDLEWDNGVRHPFQSVEAAYVVVACRPFQDWVWKGTRVHNTDIKPGDILEITLRSGKTTLKYPVERVKGKKAKEAADGNRN